MRFRVVRSTFSCTGKGGASCEKSELPLIVPLFSDTACESERLRMAVLHGRRVLGHLQTHRFMASASPTSARRLLLVGLQVAVRKALGQGLPRCDPRSNERREREMEASLCDHTPAESRSTSGGRLDRTSKAAEQHRACELCAANTPGN